LVVQVKRDEWERHGGSIGEVKNAYKIWSKIMKSRDSLEHLGLYGE
jgi:hypothetical protein